MVSEAGVWWVAHDQVDLSFFQKFDTADRSAVGDFDPDIRVRLVEPAEIFDQEITADRVTGTDTELSFEHVVAREQGFPFIKHQKGGLDVLQKKFSFRREEDFFCNFCNFFYNPAADVCSTARVNFQFALM